MKTPYTRFFWSDWIADTSHLDLMQKGAYMWVTAKEREQLSEFLLDLRRRD